MNAIHIVSTAPFFAKGGREFSVEDFDLYCTVLSALSWRRLGGRITLCADRAAAEYYRKIGFCDIWDEVNVCVPNDLEGINPKMFWAGGKLLALREVSAPVVMMDTDFIVWKNPDYGDEIIAAHREDLSPDIYPPLGFFRADGHIIPDLDETVLPLNTAFLYVPNDDFKEFYTSQAIAFMKSAADCDDTLKYMVFAEQRMAAMCAEYTGTPVKTLLDKNHLFFPQDSFTHLWGAKQAMRDNPELHTDFIEKCRKRLKTDFPDFAYLAEIIDDLQTKS
jgi:hypothetical protein